MRGGYQPLSDTKDSGPPTSSRVPAIFIYSPEAEQEFFELEGMGGEGSKGSGSEGEGGGTRFEPPDQDDEDDFLGADDEVSLRRVSGPIPYPSLLVALVEFSERFSYYGATALFVNFLQQPLPPGSTTGAGLDGQSGALGLGQRASTGLITFNTFFVYTTPLLGAYVADRFWGRFRTICVATGFAAVGHALLVVCALPENLVEPERALKICVVAMVVMGLGTGAIKGNICPLVAEQVTQRGLRIEVREGGERVCVDPKLTTSRIFLYFYFIINVGALTGQISMVYTEKHYGFYLAFLLPTFIFLLCPLILYLARNRYVRSPPSGSVLADAFRIVHFAGRGRWTHPRELLREGGEEFWARAMPSRVPVGKRPRWMTFGDEWVREVRGAVQACRVFLFFPAFWLAYGQTTSNLTSQAAVLNTHGLPNDILSNLNPLALIVLIPLCDKFFYPALSRAGVPFGPILKITLGFFVAALSMAYAAMLQYAIYFKSECGMYASGVGCTPVDINVWWQAPSYILIAVAEILASVSGLEFAYCKAPESMRSIVMSIFLFQSAIGSALGEAFVWLSADPLLVINYSVMGVVSCVAGALFWLSCQHLEEDDEGVRGRGF